MPDCGGASARGVQGTSGVVIGFDFGTKRIGLAIGQRVTGTAAPLGTIRLGSTGEPWKTISELVANWQPVLFVVGLAYLPDGGENPITADTHRFCRHLEKRYRLPVRTIDETLSTAESRQRYFERRGGRNQSFREVKDEWAAQVILQTWFDERND